MYTKNLISTFLAILFTACLSAQQWAPPGATWYYSVDGFGVNGYIMIEAAGDTSIADQDYRVLVKTQHTYNHISGTYFHGEIGREYTYYEDEKVYIWRNNVVYTLYDFGAQEGDEWTIPYTYETDTICDSTATVRCDFADTATLNGYLLKITLANPVEGSYWSLGENAELVQYIGNTSNYFLPNITEECPVADLSEGGTFRCYHDEILGWYTKVPIGECDLITGIEETEVVGGIDIYPNPCSEILRIRYRMPDAGYHNQVTHLRKSSGGQAGHRSQVTSLRFFSPDGRIVLETEIPEYQIDLDVSDLPAGIYLLRMQGESGVVVKKLVVQ